MDLSKLRDKDTGGREDGLLIVAAMIAIMWISEVVDTVIDHRLDGYGIHPRSGDGLWEIASAPFLHLGFDHLIGNTIPFAVMGAVIAFNGAARVLAVTAITAAVSGAGVWLIAPSGSVTIGASGVVFGYAAYLIARGFFSRSLAQLAVGAVVVLIWGAALLSSLVPTEGVSWQGHVFGAIGGILAARLLAPGRRELGSGADADGSRRARLAIP